jgi:hypothetical protein
MGRGDDRDRLGCRRIIEQNVTAAIDLDVDESGSKPHALRQHRDRTCRNRRPGNDLRDARGCDHDGSIVMQGCPVE